MKNRSIRGEFDRHKQCLQVILCKLRRCDTHRLDDLKALPRLGWREVREQPKLDIGAFGEEVQSCRDC